MPERITNEEALQRLCDDAGFDDAIEMAEHYLLESCVPAVCMNDGCGYVADMEPDQECGWCDECQAPSLCGLMVLLGVI